MVIKAKTIKWKFTEPGHYIGTIKNNEIFEFHIRGIIGSWDLEYRINDETVEFCVDFDSVEKTKQKAQEIINEVVNTIVEQKSD